MSTTTVLKQVLDAHVDQTRPADNFGKADRLRMGALTNEQRAAYIFFGNMPHPGIFVLSATLRVVTLTQFNSQTLTVKRITEPWKERTITWRTRPDITADSSAGGTVSANPNAALEIDVTGIISDALTGGGKPFYGFQVTTDADGPVALHSSEAVEPGRRPQLTIEWSKLPTAVSDLVPGDGDVISVAKPVLRWTYHDLENDEQGQFQVQIDNASDFASPDFDTGWVASADPQYDVSGGAYGGWGDGVVRYWRVRVKDDSGQTSAWSSGVAVTRTSKGTFTLDAPSAAIEETTPLIVTTLTGRAQSRISYLLEEVQDDATWKEVWREARFSAPASSGVSYEFRVPLVDVDSPGPGASSVQASPISRERTNYRLTVRSWDTVTNRVATPGDPTYSEVVLVLQWFATVGGPTPVRDLTAQPDESGGPGVILRWHRDVVPDFWMIRIDGEVVADHVDATDWKVE